MRKKQTFLKESSELFKMFQFSQSQCGIYTEHHRASKGKVCSNITYFSMQCPDHCALFCCVWLYEANRIQEYIYLISCIERTEKSG